MKNIRSHELYGRFAIFASAFCFYLATVAIRWARAEGLDLPSPLFVFVRFFFGSLIVAASLLAKRQAIAPCQLRFLFGRALFNVSAVLCFFRAIQMTTAAEGNILNMTYPIFAALISWFVFKEQRDRIAVAMTFVAFCGMLMMLLSGEASLGGFQIQINSLWGLASGILAAISIVFLNLARRENSTETVLLFNFGIGSLLLLLFFYNSLYLPNLRESFFLIFSASMGIAGQYLLTLGFRYVSAIEGSIISSTRILIASLLGPFITADPALALNGWLGALLILGANIYFIVRRARR